MRRDPSLRVATVLLCMDDHDDIDPEIPDHLLLPPTPYATDLEHLEDCIARIHLLVAASCARASRRRDPTSEDIVRCALSRVSDAVPSAVARLWDLADARGYHIEERLDRSREQGFEPALARLSREFELSPREQDVLVLAAAPAIDARYVRDWERIESAATRPTVSFAISVLGRTFEEGLAMRSLFSTRAPLIGESLLSVGRHAGWTENDFLDVSLELPRRVVSELLGSAAIAEELQAFSRLRTPLVPMDQVVLPAELKDTVRALVGRHDVLLEKRRVWGIDDVVTYGRGVVLLFAGAPGTGKTMLAHAIGHELGKRLFVIDAGKLAEGHGDAERNLDAIFREAKLLDAVLFFDECEQMFVSRRFGNEGIPLLLTKLEAFEGIAILATNMAQALDEALQRRTLASFHFGAPSPTARAEIWRKHLPAKLPLDADVDVEALARAFELTGGYIKNAVLAAVSHAVAEQREVITQDDLLRGARLQLRVPEDAAVSIEKPQARLADVVLAPHARRAVERIVTAARVRGTVLAEWGLGDRLPRGGGIAALLEGPPGTGKSMTAEAIAHALGRPMLLCNVASVVSKYVGDTAKNLEKLFATARQQNAVLVFDEADALFAKRVAVHGAHDRFVNAESAALLTMLERHDGVVILTTNLAAELDPAFARRLLVHVSFGAPDAQAREAIWQSMLPKQLPLAGDVDVTELARAFALTGREIKNAVLAAAFEAAGQGGVVTREMLLRTAAEQGGAQAEPAAVVRAESVN